MNQITREFINEHIYRRFLTFMESVDAGEMAYALTDEVMKDVLETADPDNWHSGDVDIALGRVLINRITKQ